MEAPKSRYNQENMNTDAQMRKAMKDRVVHEDKRKAGRLDEPFCLMIFLLLGLGLIMLFSASYASALAKTGNSTFFFTKQAIFAVIGVIAMYIASKVDHRIYIKLLPVLCAVTLGLMLITSLMGKEANGAGRWLEFGGIQIQPSEIAKFTIILFFAASMGTKDAKEIKKLKSFGLYFFVVVLTCGLLALQKHLSACVIIGLTSGIMMFVGGVRFIYLATLGGLGLAGGLGYIAMNAYAQYRVQVWLDPFSDFRGKGWQGGNSLITIGSGGLWGTGLGMGRQKHLYLPEPANDFIFSVVCEELGLIGATLVLIIFAVFILRGYYIALRAPDKYSSLLAAGITTHIAIQIMLNICVVTGLMPVTGISLPFFSYGGTALLMLLGEVGILLNISRYIKAPREQ